MAISHTSTAQALGIPRTTFLRYLKQGCPGTSDEACDWISEHFPKQLDKPTVYSSKPLKDTDSIARFKRLKDSEAYLASQIKTIQEKTLPELVSGIADASGKEKQDLERQMQQVYRDLLTFRKEHTKISKTISDIELKRQAVNKDMIPRGWVHDEFIRLYMDVVNKCNDLSRGKPEAEATLIDNTRNTIFKYLAEIDTKLTAVLMGVRPVGYESGK